MQPTGRVRAARTERQRAVAAAVVGFAFMAVAGMSVALVAGGLHTFRAPTSSERPTIGASALVSYDPLDPADAHDLSDSARSWELPFYTGAILLTIVLVESLAVATFVVRRRARRSRG